MKLNKIYLFLLLFIVFFLPGCGVIAGIFKAGFWTAIVLVVIIVALIVFALKKMSGH